MTDDVTPLITVTSRRIEFEDFCFYFDEVVISHKTNDSSFPLFKKTRKEARIFASWCKTLPKNSDGITDDQYPFLQNPQFMFDIHGEEDVVICLQQEDQTILRNKEVTKSGLESKAKKKSNNSLMAFKVYNVRLH
ncbi:calpain-5-like [Protopterus annectens]|uniref:calpain-5-like n=1 Tax=Protopterus annectens TaxID=7888 RepID=UPI001CFB7631|nr:calpain-5-like [Protopterus annectens]